MIIDLNNNINNNNRDIINNNNNSSSINNYNIVLKYNQFKCPFCNIWTNIIITKNNTFKYKCRWCKVDLSKLCLRFRNLKPKNKKVI